MAEKSKGIKLKGIVSSGKGLGRKFIELDWVKKQLKEKLGFNPYPGTLNLILMGKEIEKREKLEKFKGITLIPENGYCKAKCMRVNIKNFSKINSAIIFPDVPEYPNNLIEILAPLNLRKTLNLKNGDLLEISVYPE